MKKNLFLLSLAALTGLVFFSSCSKHDNPNTTPSSSVFVLHASPGSPAFNFFINGQKITSSPLAYTQGESLEQAAGNCSFSFVNPKNSDTVAHVLDTLKPGGSYSVIIYDTTNPLKLMVLQDTHGTSQDATDSYVRFLQLCPGQVVRYYVDSVEAFSGRTDDYYQNKALAEFLPLTKGSHNYAALNSAGDTLAKLSNITLSPGKSYTFYLSGIPGHTDSTGVRLRVMANY